MTPEPINRHQRRVRDAGHEVDLPDVAYDTSQASIYTGLAAATLETLRTRGGGPRFIRYGRKAVRYRRSDLHAFMAERSFTSTSEVEAA